MHFNINAQFFRSLFHNHTGKAIGAGIGFVFGLLVLLFGFLQTVFVLGCVLIGFIVGKHIDENEDLMDILDKILPPSYHR